MLAMQRAVVTRLLTEMTPDEALAAGRLLESVWPGRGADGRAEQLLTMGSTYTGPPERAPRSFLVYDEDKVIGHALVFHRRVVTEQGELSTLALAMVASDPDYRGQGLGALVVKQAFAMIDKGVYPFCFYQTSFPVESFYEKLGACRVTNKIVNSLSSEDPEANPFWDDLVMRYPAEREWPEGVIDLQGPGY